MPASLVGNPTRTPCSTITPYLEDARQGISMGGRNANANRLSLDGREPQAVLALVVPFDVDQVHQGPLLRRAVRDGVVAHGLGLGRADDPLVDRVGGGERQLALETGVEDELDRAELLRPVPRQL